ncbi:uncharacterized protein WCC33_014246 [Rhinophrynus dorsalis]
MDKFYVSLREELRVFEGQVQKCRVNFDLQTLHRVLALVSKSHGTELDSWQHIENLVKSDRSSGEQWQQIQSYLSWLLSYVEYLRSMKKAFDDRVVFPLSDNLYVNDEGENVSPPGLQIPLSPANIAATARQLFHHRRSWALLLSTGTLGQTHPIHGASNSTILLHCIPDIFEESLVTASLAQNWILIHEARYQNNIPASQEVQRVHLSREFQSSPHVRKELWGSSPSLDRGDPQTPDRQKDTREDMMFLLWRAGRAEALELQVKEAKNKVRNLQQEMNEVQQLIQIEGKGTSEGHRQLTSDNQMRMEKLKRQLDLEQFHQEILKSDWQLELEVRPSLIRQIATVRERCIRFEDVLNQRREQSEESAQDSVGALSDTDWDSSSVFSHPSTLLPDMIAPH